MKHHAAGFILFPVLIISVLLMTAGCGTAPASVPPVQSEAGRSAADQNAETAAAEQYNTADVLQNSQNSSTAQQDYGVFIGMTPEQAAQTGAYRRIIIDASDFTEEEIQALHSRDTEVYSYLNIGSIETFRSYYAQFRQDRLAPYAGWKDEYWMDVSDPAWQNYTAEVLAPALKDKGIDGLFLDNFDVYWRYPNDQIYTGLTTILKMLDSLGLPVVINGGDEYVRAALRSGELPACVKGVNQESVFTASDPDSADWYQTYLKDCAAGHLDCWLIEYQAGEKQRKEAEEYCKTAGYHVFFADDEELDQE